jgi:hypothetical protein
VEQEEGGKKLGVAASLRRLSFLGALAVSARSVVSFFVFCVWFWGKEERERTHGRKGVGHACVCLGG